MGEQPFNFQQFEDNFVDIINQYDNDNKNKYRDITILLKTYALTTNPNENIIQYLGEVLYDLKPKADDATILQPPTTKEINNHITKEQLKTVRDTLYNHIQPNRYNKDCLAFLISSIYLHCPPIRPGELSNTLLVQSQLKTNFLDLQNLKWHINHRKNGDTHILDIPQALADDIQLIRNIHGSIHLIPQIRTSNRDMPMAERQILREVQSIFNSRFNIPNFTFQINRKSQISYATPYMTGQQKKDYAKQCGHSVQTQQLIYNTYNQQ
jgi:hypothetical protein